MKISVEMVENGFIVRRSPGAGPCVVAGHNAKDLAQKLAELFDIPGASSVCRETGCNNPVIEGSKSCRGHA